MVSNQKLQSSLKEMKEITGRRMALFQSAGSLAVVTDDEMMELRNIAEAFAESVAEIQTYRQYRFYPVMVDGEREYVFVSEGTDDTSENYARLAICQIKILIQSMEEQFDRNHFIRNILLGNMLTVDIFSQARKLHVEPAGRVVFVIDMGDKRSDEAMESVKNLSDLMAGDFVTSLDEHSIILVKNVSVMEGMGDEIMRSFEGTEENTPAGEKIFEGQALEEVLAAFAASLVDNLQTDAMVRVRVGYGNLVYQIPDIAQSYQEARMALQVGRVFYADRDTISYSRLGIGRLIYQLPMSLCEMYIREVFGEQVPAILEDEEAMSTINRFFENNLNISETARQLYVHRNTLVYRLERIEKAIGLDIRSFDDAMTFRLAVMVLAHMRDAEK